MSGPKVKVNDRVHVEFDGTVHDEDSDGTFAVRPGDALITVHWVPVSAITVLPPAIVRDDVIDDAGVLDAMPDESVVSAGGHVWVRYTPAWRTTTVDGSCTSCTGFGVLCHYGPATVLRVGR